MIKFRTFRPEWDWDEKHSCNCCTPPAMQINDWLKSNPNIEVISWQASSRRPQRTLYYYSVYGELI